MISKSDKVKANNLPMTKTPSIGVGVLVTRGDRVLLLRRINAHGAGSWSPPGGHLEIGETQEETGLDIGEASFLAITNDIFAEEGLHYITIWMKLEVVKGEAVVNAPEEAAEVGWFAWNALPEPLFLPLRHLLAGESYPHGALQKEKYQDFQDRQEKKIYQEGRKRGKQEKDQSGN